MQRVFDVTKKKKGKLGKKGGRSNDEDGEEKLEGEQQGERQRVCVKFYTQELGTELLVHLFHHWNGMILQQCKYMGKQLRKSKK